MDETTGLNLIAIKQQPLCWFRAATTFLIGRIPPATSLLNILGFVTDKMRWHHINCKCSNCQKSDSVFEFIATVTINNTKTVDVAIVAPVFVVVIIFFVVIAALLLIKIVVIVTAVSVVAVVVVAVGDVAVVVGVVVVVVFVVHKFTIEHN